MLGKPKVFASPHLAGPLAGGNLANACGSGYSSTCQSNFTCGGSFGGCIDTNHCDLGTVVISVVLVGGGG